MDLNAIDHTIVAWILEAVLTGIAVYAVRILSKLGSSVERLNIKMAVIIEQVSSHEKRIFVLEDDNKKSPKGRR